MSKVALADCPIGLFESEDGTLCLKTEYSNNAGRIDAYIVSTGEFFWGASPQTIQSQRAQIVTPVQTTSTITDYGAANLIALLKEHIKILANWMELNGDDGNEPFLFYKVIADARAAIGE